MPSAAPFAGQPIQRQDFLPILQMAITYREYRFSREAALSWLAVYPGDLPVRHLYAESLLNEGRARQAIPILEALCQADPEDLEAHERLYRALQMSGTATPPELLACLLALRSSQGNPAEAPAWGADLGAALKALKQGELVDAAEKIQAVLHAHTAIPLVGVAHLALLSVTDDTPLPVERKLAEYYYQSWPECLQCTLYLADWLMDGGESDQAVVLLHRAAAHDITGIVAGRLWGDTNPYRNLWPEDMEAAIELTVPAKIAAALGWNQLTAGQEIPGGDEANERLAPDVTLGVAIGVVAQAGSAEESKEPLPDWLVFDEELASKTSPKPAAAMAPESLVAVQAELDRLARRLKKPGLSRTDGRFPVYVVFSVKEGLEKAYGAAGAKAILLEMAHLVEAVQQHQPKGEQRWGARLFLADDPDNLPGLGVHPAKADDPWEIKLALTDLDEALARHGEMVGALLIVGGPEVVPFHRLPNPVDDPDVDVPSDNPYSTRDENYFIPEWPVGRLPGGIDQDPGLILQQLKRVIAGRIAATRPLSAYSRARQRVLILLRPERIFRNWSGSQYSFGYTAAVWRRASYQVYQPIGRPIDMWISPALSHHPNGAPKNGNRSLPLATLGYFNLHGVPDSPEWFGQRDPFDSGDGPDYPIALTPEDLDMSGKMKGSTTPKIVFSEACFGAHILDKQCQEALALKFLAAGSELVVGSTCMAYGSITDQLSAADLLGHSFWSNLKDGLAAGEALRRAKIQMARDLQSRQGYLDGMDQKTLISFVLYGDPLAQPVRMRKAAKSIQRQLQNRIAVSTICDLDGDQAANAELNPREQEYIRHVVSKYLPGMQDAELDVREQHSLCAHCQRPCPTNQLHSKSVQPGKPPEGRRMVILSKTIHRGKQDYTQFARMTLDPDGKLIKLVVSR